MASKARLETDAYVAEMNKRAAKYVEGVLNGKIIVNKFIRQAVERGIRDKKNKDYVIRQDKIDKVFAFFSFLNIPKDGSPVSIQFKLSPFQAWILSELFGYYKVSNGKRRYTKGLVWMARKGGKTIFVIGIDLYLFVADGQMNPQVYLAANTAFQSSKLLGYAKDIIEASPALKKRIKIKMYELNYKRGLFASVANTPDKLDGLNPSAVIIDEYHEADNDKMYSIFKTGMLAREESLLMVISTAGFDKGSPFFSMLEVGKRVLNREVDSEAFFYALYTLDDDDDPEDENVWIKANPNLGITITKNRFREDFEEAKLSPTEYSKFLVKNLNLYTDSSESWIPDDDYRKVYREVTLDDLAGRNVYIGIDLAATRDLSAMVAIAEGDNEDEILVYPEFYFPMNPAKMVRSNGYDLTHWINDGWIQQHPTKTIDQDLVVERISAIAGVANIIMGVGVDPWGSTQLVKKIEEIGIDIYKCPQNAPFFNSPVKFVERLIFDDKCSMSANPVLRWHFRNVVMYYDGNANAKPAKNKSRDSIDGVVALLDAVGVYLEIQYKLGNILN